MSLAHEVAQRIQSAGHLTVDDLTAIYPANTRTQLMDALKYGSRMGLVQVVKCRKRGGGSTTVWGPYTGEPVVRRARPIPRPACVPISAAPVASVWQLGDRALAGLPGWINRQAGAL